jgi:agmatine deiminase
VTSGNRSIGGSSGTVSEWPVPTRSSLYLSAEPYPMLRIRTLSLLVFALSAAAVAQDLPHALAPSEVPLIRAYRDSRADDTRGISDPPAFPVRTMAEWEEIQSLCITWASFESILKQIVVAAKSECEVIIICESQQDVIAYLQSSLGGGPIDNLDNITFIEGNFNSIWMRDYGAETMYMNDVDSLFLMDWIYNRPRPADDQVPDLIGQTKNITVFESNTAPNDLVHTGGNFMADGFGTAFSSNLVIDENGAGGDFNQTVHTPAEVDGLLTTWMGIQPGRYVRMETLPYDGIHHIDMHMKLVDEERLLVGQFPNGISDGPQIEANLSLVLGGTNSVFGTPYKAIRIPMPPNTSEEYAPDASYRTYANNVFVNKTVIVPLYRTEYDTTALRILHETLPGYRIVGIDCDSGGDNIISQSGAIHCITKGIGVADPLLIKHQPLSDTYDTQNPYPVAAWMKHRSGIASATLFWSVDTAQAWNEVAMIDAGADNWTASIPAQAVGTTVFYYVEGHAVNGKVLARPITAPDGWWKFRVLDINSAIVDPAGPQITEAFPNPCTSHLVITIDHTRSEAVRVSLVDALGREAMVLNNGPLYGDRRVLADVSGLAPGTYALVVDNGLGRSVQRIVKR